MSLVHLGCAAGVQGVSSSLGLGLVFFQRQGGRDRISWCCQRVGPGHVSLLSGELAQWWPWAILCVVMVVIFSKLFSPFRNK